MKLVVLFILSGVVTAVLVLTASASEKATSPCVQDISRGHPIGAGNVLHGHVYIGRAEKYGDGNRLFSGNVICTGQQGLFRFNVTLSSKGVACKVKAESALELGPLGKALLNYRAGTSRCQINGGGLRWLKTPTAMIRTRDPWFTITVGRRRTTVSVRRGSVRVFGTSGGKSVAVGANQQTVVKAGAAPTAPTSTPAQSVQEQKDYGQLAAPLPPGSVTTRTIQDGAVTTAKLADNAVSLKKLNPAARAGMVGPSGPAGPAGAPGPPGATGPAGPSSALGFASRDVAGSPEAVPSGFVNAGVLNLDIASGTAGYVASSGPVTATAPSRLVATADITLRNDSGAASSFFCRLARFTEGQADQLPFGIMADSTVAAGVQASLPLTAGLDVGPGTYNVRVQCAFGGFPQPIVFIRGNLTVVVAPL